MTQLAELIAYVNGPTESRSFLGLGKRKIIYSVNPQLYLQGYSAPILNFGVNEHIYNISDAPTKENFTDFLRKNLKSRLGDRIEIRDRPIIPAECIDITIQFL